MSNMSAALLCVLIALPSIVVVASFLIEEHDQVQRRRKRAKIHEFCVSCECMSIIGVSSLGYVEPARPGRLVKCQHIIDTLTKLGIPSVFDSHDDGGSNYIIFEGVDYGQAIVDFLRNGYADMSFDEFMEKLIGR